MTIAGTKKVITLSNGRHELRETFLYAKQGRQAVIEDFVKGVFEEFKGLMYLRTLMETVPAANRALTAPTAFPHCTRPGC
ncbi:hypothetical protein SAMN05216316_2495 [Nitrosovibrio sp. Nv6]|nr:hypothetical protein SAMN05216316_2495 [Nitrosovibrio sp. Nv6]